MAKVSIEPEGLHLVQTALAPTDTEVVVELPQLTLAEDITRVCLASALAFYGQKREIHLVSDQNVQSF